MSDTTGNQDLSIVTNGTGHTATTTGATDTCKLPNNVPVPFPNFIKSAGNVQNGTTNTFIADQTVMHQSANLGPVSDPGHAGVQKGVGSGTYRDIAKPTSWSKDVQMEGKGVVRTNDSTTQNKDNTSGMMVGATLQPVVSAQDTYDQRLCTIVELVGECDHGRLLGPPPGKEGDGAEANYLEVIECDTVNFISTRKDVTKDVIDPGCVKGIHTHWDIKKTGGGWLEAAKEGAKSMVGLGDPEEEHEDSEKEYDLETGKESSFEAGEGERAKSKVTDFTRRRRSAEPTDTLGRKLGGGYGNAITHKVDNDANLKQETFKLGLKGLKQAAVMWDAAANPREILVEACACSGKKEAKIRVLPKDKIDLDLFDDSVKALVKKILGPMELLQYAGGLCGASIQIKTFNPDSCKINFTIEYKELTEDRPLRAAPFGFGQVGPHYKVQCRKKWTLELQLDPLFDITAEFDGPITAAIPMIGPAATAVLRLIGAKADFFFKAEANIKATANVSWDQYDEIVASGSATLTFTFSAGVKVFVTWAEVTLYAYVKVTFKADEFGPRPGYLIGCNTDVTIQIGIKGAAKVNFWGYTYSKDLDYKPEWGKWDWKGTLNFRKTPGTYLDAGSQASSGNLA